MRNLYNHLICVWENTLYYLGTMTLFNLIYALKICGTNLNDGKLISEYGLALFVLAIVLFFAGFVSTMKILCTDHSIQSSNTLGKVVTVVKCENITGDNFFSKYSILVLTGNSLPVFNNYISLVLYLIVLITLGIVYCTQKMYYMNPCFGIMNFNIAKAICKTQKGDVENYYFIYKEGKISEGTRINFINIPNKIIRLKEINGDPSNKAKNRTNFTQRNAGRI